MAYTGELFFLFLFPTHHGPSLHWVTFLFSFLFPNRPWAFLLRASSRAAAATSPSLRMRPRPSTYVLRRLGKILGWLSQSLSSPCAEACHPVSSGEKHTDHTHYPTQFVTYPCGWHALSLSPHICAGVRHQGGGGPDDRPPVPLCGCVLA